MSILEELKKKLSDIEIQNLAMEGCSPTFTVSDIMDLIDSVELAQNLHNACTDTISRQAAIDAVEKESQVDGAYGYMDTKSIVDLLNALPPAQPERKKGKWIYGEDEYGIDGYHCDKCGFFVPWDYAHTFINYIEDYNFCPNCGADMRGEQE